MRSLRAALIVRLLFVLTIASLGAGVAAYFAALYDAGEFMDDQLLQLARLDPACSRLPNASLREPESLVTMTVWRDNGILEREDLNGPRGVFRPPGLSGFIDFEASGERWRGYVVRGAHSTLLLAQRASARDEIAQHSALEATLPILATLPIVWLVVAVAVGTVMRSLAATSSNILTWGIDGDQEISSAGLPREIAPFIASINDLTTRLRDGFRHQRRFVADAAHELRTPLTALRIQSHALSLAKTQTELNQAADALRKGIDRACLLVDKLLKLARVEASAADALDISADLAEALSESVAEFAPIAELAGIDLGLEVSGHWPASLPHDSLRLLFDNILDNAIRYNTRGGTVDCKLRPGSAGARVTVIDTGIGISNAAMPHIFERFRRAAPAAASGTGLGLAIVKAVADKHKLQIKVENRPDRTGIQATVDFPGVIRAP